MKIQDAFADSYARARVLFLEAAAIHGLALQSFTHPMKGAQGETLALDMALDGPRDAQRLLVVSSACHGVAGFGGSGVQVSALHDAEWRQRAAASGVAVLYLHALNPYGFSHCRITQENELHHLQQSDAGDMALRWSEQTLRHILQNHAQRAQRMAWIDLHTGAGPTGWGERIWAGRDDPIALARARRWWEGEHCATPITSMADDTSISAKLSGLMAEAFYEACPQAEFTRMALVFGTVSNINTPEWRAQVIVQARQALFQAVAGLSEARK